MQSQWSSSSHPQQLLNMNFAVCLTTLTQPLPCNAQNQVKVNTHTDTGMTTWSHSSATTEFSQRKALSTSGVSFFPTSAEYSRPGKVSSKIRSVYLNLRGIIWRSQWVTLLTVWKWNRWSLRGIFDWGSGGDRTSCSKVLLEKSKDLIHVVAIRKKYLAEKKSIALPVIKKLSNLK